MIVVSFLIHNKSQLIHPGCLWPSIVLQCRIVAENTVHFISSVILLLLVSAYIFQEGNDIGQFLRYTNTIYVISIQFVCNYDMILV